MFNKNILQNYWISYTILDIKIISCHRVSCSFVYDSLRPQGLWPSRFLCPWDSPGKNTGMGCHSLLQGIFVTRRSNPGLLHCKQILYRLSDREDPILSCELLNFTFIWYVKYIWNYFPLNFIVLWTTILYELYLLIIHPVNGIHQSSSKWQSCDILKLKKKFFSQVSVISWYTTLCKFKRYDLLVWEINLITIS